MSNFIWWIGVLKYIGVLGFVPFGSEREFFRFFMLFWLLGVLEIFLTFPIFVQSLKQIIGIPYIYINNKLNLKGSNISDDVLYMLPFEGEWTVVNGGITKDTSHSWFIYSQRFAYDFVILDNEEKSSAGSPNIVNNYFCYGKKILSPADGVVVEIKDGNKDSKIMGYGRTDPTAKDLRGNYVVIKHSRNQYSVLAHLKPQSIKVCVGQNVKVGEYIALCGNTGNTTEPHLHFQVQNGKSFFGSMGVPIKFYNMEVVGYCKTYKQSSVFQENNENGMYICRGLKVKNK